MYENNVYQAKLTLKIIHIKSWQPELLYNCNVPLKRNLKWKDRIELELFKKDYY